MQISRAAAYRSSSGFESKTNRQYSTEQDFTNYPFSTSLRARALPRPYKALVGSDGFYYTSGEENTPAQHTGQLTSQPMQPTSSIMRSDFPRYGLRRICLAANLLLGLFRETTGPSSPVWALLGRLLFFFFFSDNYGRGRMTTFAG